MQRSITFETFSVEFCAYFDLEVGSVSRASLLDSDLGFDSIMYLEILLMLEEAANTVLAEDLMAGVRTVGDVYELFIQYEGLLEN